LATININTKCLRRGWALQQVGFLVYLLDQADNWGLIHRKPKVWAADTGISPADIERMLTLFMDREVFLPYQDGTETYLATPHWQDEQTRKYFSVKGPLCPIPPIQVFRKLSDKTKGNFRKCADKLPRPCAVAVADAVADDYKVNEWMQDCIRLYTEDFKKNLAGGGESPTIDVADLNLLKQRLMEASKDDPSDGWRRVRTVIGEAVSGRDWKFRNSPPALRTILYAENYNRLKATLARESASE